MTDTDAAPPLPDNWSELDSHDTFFEYLRLVREEMLAGKELPSMFLPSARVAK